MFGVVPRVVWSRNVASDALGRIEIALNCLLLERVGGGQGDGPRRILIEAGCGDKIDAKMRKIYALSERTVTIALEEIGCAAGDVDHVIVSHLHFDHCGGLTRLARQGETPEWHGRIGHGTDEAGVVVSFPRAAVAVQRREWEDAISGRTTMTRTYLADNLEPLRQRVRLVESPPPYAPGVRPRRGESVPIKERMTSVLPGIEVFLVPGHTWGQQAIVFTDATGQRVVFSPDVIPTIHHVGLAYNMAYDQEPFLSGLTRYDLLKTAAEEDWLLVLDHELGNPLQRVRPDGKGWFKLEAAEIKD